MTAINVRWHTEGRRQPTLIGKDASGRKIPGGPYIVWQLLALPVAPLMWSTRYSWAGGLSGLAMLVIIAATTAAAFYLIGRLDFAGRNPILALGALAVAVLLATTARSGKLGRSRVRRIRPPRNRRAQPAPAWHTDPAESRAAAAEDIPSSVQPVTTAAGAAAATVDQPNHQSTQSTGSSVTPTSAAQTADQPTRMSPLEAFMAAAGKVNS